MVLQGLGHSTTDGGLMEKLKRLEVIPGFLPVVKLIWNSGGTGSLDNILLN
jgi:hypothetical protein